jgi:type IV pilus assembly protein PilY1
MFGERRGGGNYYALNIESSTGTSDVYVGGYSTPSYRYQIGRDYLSNLATTYEPLGQSWGKPASVKVAIGTTTDAGVTTATKRDAFVLSGGYDVGQDADSPVADDEGRAVLIVDEVTGELLHGFGHMNPNVSGTFDYRSDMLYCVTDVMAAVGTSYSGVNANIVNRLYFGDLGGNVFAVADDLIYDTAEVDGVVIGVRKELSNGDWSLFKKVFDEDDSSGRKILYAPTSTTSTDGVDLVLFGTGDRAHPNDVAVSNRFYCVVNDWNPGTTLTASALANVTGGTALPTSEGWFITLGTGEKVVSRPILYGGTAIFTTYTPPGSATTTAASDDPCVGTGARGVGKLYLLSVSTGQGSDDVKATNLTEVDDGVYLLPDTLPMAQPMMDGTTVRVGTTLLKLVLKKQNDYFYWRQL